MRGPQISEISEDSTKQGILAAIERCIEMGDADKAEAYSRAYATIKASNTDRPPKARQVFKGTMKLNKQRIAAGIKETTNNHLSAITPEAAIQIKEYLGINRICHPKQS